MGCGYLLTFPIKQDKVSKTSKVSISRTHGGLTTTLGETVSDLCFQKLILPSAWKIHYRRPRGKAEKQVGR